MARLRREVNANGYTFECILSDDGAPPYTYTIGLSKNFGHPEIYLAGLRFEPAQQLIRSLVERIKKGERFDEPCYVEELIHYDMPIRPMTPETLRDNAGTGWSLLGGQFNAVQLFYPDASGFVPWEKECDPSYAQQLHFELAGSEPVRTRPIPEIRRYATPDGKRPPEEEIQARRRAGIERMRKIIDQEGWTLQPVFGNGQSPDMVYTIGLSKTYGHPEMFMTGIDFDHQDLNEEVMVQILAVLATRVVNGERFDTPQYVSELFEIPVPVRPLDPAAVLENSGLGQEVLNGGFPAMQVYFPDENGLFPWEQGCDPEAAEAQMSVFTPVGEVPEKPEPPKPVLH